MKIISKDDIESRHYLFARGEATSKSLVETPSILVSVSTISPNARLPDKPHEHARHEMLYVQKGTLQIHVGQETREAKAGDVVFLEPYEAHSLTTGEQEVILLEAFWE